MCQYQTDNFPEKSHSPITWARVSSRLSHCVNMSSPAGEWTQTGQSMSTWTVLQVVINNQALHAPGLLSACVCAASLLMCDGCQFEDMRSSLRFDDQAVDWGHVVSTALIAFTSPEKALLAILSGYVCPHKHSLVGKIKSCDSCWSFSGPTVFVYECTVLITCVGCLFMSELFSQLLCVCMSAVRLQHDWLT